jgi:hypothetical protein
MASALSSVFGGGNILNIAMSVASVAFPPLGLATSAANLLTGGVGQAVMGMANQLVKESGMPKFVQDMIGDVVKDVVGKLTQSSDHHCDNAVKDHCGGTLQDIIRDLTKQLVDNVNKQLEDCGGEKAKPGKGAKGSQSWMQAIAQAMGDAAGKKAAELVKFSNQLTEIAGRNHSDLSDEVKNGTSPRSEAQQADAKEQASVNAQFQAASQEFNMLQSAFSNAIKSIGEGIATMSRKG